MTPSCFALQVSDVRGLQVSVGTSLRTALVSLERLRACIHSPGIVEHPQNCESTRLLLLSSRYETVAWRL